MSAISGSAIVSLAPQKILTGSLAWVSGSKIFWHPFRAILLPIASNCHILDVTFLTSRKIDSDFLNRISKPLSGKI